MGGGASSQRKKAAAEARAVAEAQIEADEHVFEATLAASAAEANVVQNPHCS